MREEFVQQLARTAALLEEKRDNQLNMFIGVDGFVDEIIHVVGQRHDAHHFDRVETIAEYAEKISKAAGLSTNIEYVTTNVKLGGNGPIFANALVEYDVDVTYIGAIGTPVIHPVFQPLAERCTAYSLSDPGHTDAVEFFDGKLIIGKHQAIREIGWESFRDTLGGPERIAEIISKCHLFGMENWTMVTGMGEIWDGLVREVFPLLLDRQEPPIAFFDLADPEKRSREDILHALEQIRRFEPKFRAVLGLNEKEAYEIAKQYGDIQPPAGLSQEDELAFIAKAIYDKLQIHCLVVHPTKCAVACTRDGFYRAEGPYCEKPVLTTGAGDNFNAGFCFALSHGLDPESALITGVATSGYYVRNAKSPTVENLLSFLAQWQSGALC